MLDRRIDLKTQEENSFLRTTVSRLRAKEIELQKIVATFRLKRDLKRRKS